MDFQKHQCTSKSLGASVNSCNFGGVCQPTSGDGEVLWFTTESLLFWEKVDGSFFLFSQKGTLTTNWMQSHDLSKRRWGHLLNGLPHLSRSKFLIKFTTTYSESRGISMQSLSFQRVYVIVLDKAGTVCCLLFIWPVPSALVFSFVPFLCPCRLRKLAGMWREVLDKSERDRQTETGCTARLAAQTAQDLISLCDIYA